MSLETENHIEPAAEASIESATESKGVSKKRKKLRRKRVRKAAANRRKKGWSVIVVGLVLLLLAGGAAACFFLLGEEEPVTVEQVITEEVKEEPEELEKAEEKPDMGEGILEHIITAGKAAEEAYEKRPPEVDLSTLSDISEFADITSCEIDTSVGKVKVTMTADGLPQSDDKFYYLLDMNTYDRTLPEGAEYITRTYKDSEIELTAALNNNSSTSRLYKKFVVAVKLDGKYVPVTTPKYITNPEVIAKHTPCIKHLYPRRDFW